MVFFLTSLVIFTIAVGVGTGIGYGGMALAHTANGGSIDEFNDSFRGFLLDENQILMGIKGEIDKVLKPIANLLPDQANMVFGMLLPTSVLDVVTEFIPTNALFGALGKLIKKASKAVTTATARAASALGKGTEYMIGDAFGEVTEQITKEIREAMVDAAKQGKREAKALGLKGKAIDNYILQRVEVATEAARRHAQDKATADLMGIDVSDLRNTLIRQGIDPDASARSIYNAMRLRVLNGVDEAAELAADTNRVLDNVDYAVNYTTHGAADGMLYADNYADEILQYTDNYADDVLQYGDNYVADNYVAVDHFVASTAASKDLATQAVTQTRQVMDALGDAKSLQKADALDLNDVVLQVDNRPPVMRAEDASVVTSTSRGKPRAQLNPEADLATLNPRPPGARQHLSIQTSTGHGSVKGQVADVVKWLIGGDPRTKAFYFNKGKHVMEQMIIDQAIANGMAAHAHFNNGYSSYWDAMGLNYPENEDDINFRRPWGMAGPTGGTPPDLTTPFAWFDDIVFGDSDDEDGSENGPETSDPPAPPNEILKEKLPEFRGSNDRRHELLQSSSAATQAAEAPIDAASLALLAALGVVYVSSKT
jgi:hypothetical protein